MGAGPVVAVMVRKPNCPKSPTGHHSRVAIGIRKAECSHCGDVLRIGSRKTKPKAMVTTVHNNGQLVLLTVWSCIVEEAISVRPEDARQLRKELDAIIWEHDL